MYLVSRFVYRFARALLGGAALATVWVNIDPNSYYDAVEFRLADLSLPAALAVPEMTITPLSLVTGGLMALFLFYIGKELWEAVVLERGALSGHNRLAMPFGAVLGGMVGVAAMWFLWSRLFVTAEDAGFLTGWTVPLGSDVILCYISGRAVFGRDHPALHLLLLITIAFDILGLLFSGLVSPLSEIRPLWLVLPVVALAVVWFGFGRLANPASSEVQHRRAFGLWAYLVAGALVWLGVALAGLPPALGLLPMIPVIPHAERSFGLFAEAEAYLSDPLNRIARLVLRPMPWILFLFGLTRGGVDFAAWSPTTGAVLASLWLGKPLGLILGVLLVGVLSGRLLPAGLRLSDLMLVALICGAGFTMPVLAIGNALPGGEVAEAARLGLAISLLAGPVALILSRLRRR